MVLKSQWFVRATIGASSIALPLARITGDIVDWAEITRASPPRQDHLLKYLTTLRSSRASKTIRSVIRRTIEDRAAWSMPVLKQ
jgi:hypothetical protein